MSELKWNWVYYPYLDAPNKQEESALKAGYIKVVIKDEADKVIEEKDAKILALDAEVLKQKHHASLFFDERNYAETQLRHQKFKRCEAMHDYCLCELEFAFRDPCIERSIEGCVRWRKWANRWLELAEKFKEAK